MARRAIAATTFALLALSLVISVAWLVTARSGESKFEPLVESIAISGGLIGVFADRLAARQERRHQTLLSIGTELAENGRVLDEPVFHDSPRMSGRPLIYPRLRLSAVDAALASGALLDLGDEQLLQRVHEWRDAVADFNHRLDLAELRGFVVGSPEEPRALHLRMIRQGGPVSRLVDQHDRIVGHLRAAYGTEEAVRRSLPAAVPPTATPPTAPGLGPAA